MTTTYLLPPTPVDSLVAYQAMGGGVGLAEARRIGPDAVIERITRARLRGRGGAGFPTGLKWRGVADAPAGQHRYLVCNAAEGEPGTFKDRALIRGNPYQLLEGIAIGALAVGADVAYVGIKETYVGEIARLDAAATEMLAAGELGDIPIHIVTGPDDYLLGEEKGLLEAIEGRQPLPRLLPPYILGLHVGESSGVGSATSGWDDQYNPTAVNNVETFSHVPHILAKGADWFRAIGTADTPGTLVATVSGDVVTETVVEVPAGTPLSVLIHGYAGGTPDGRPVAVVFSGASNAPITPDLLDTPLDFASMAAIGSGLGSTGMIVHDDTACPIQAAIQLSRFLAIESCGQCPPCKLGSRTLTERLITIHDGHGDATVIEELAAWTGRVTDANRCGLGAGERSLVAGLLRSFLDELADHAQHGCRRPRTVRLAKMTDWDPDAGRFTYDDAYFEWRQA